MTIYNSEGNVYKLRGPNPLMSEQSLDWDKNKLVLHNFSWDSEIAKDPVSPEELFKKEHPQIDISEELNLRSNSEWIPPFEFVNELKDTKPIVEKTAIEEIPEEFPVIDEPKEKQTKELNVSSQVARIFKERGMEFHCAPVMKITMKDDLYGTEYKMNRYGDKFVFDGVVIEENDLELIYWCIKTMTEGSIIMPRRKESRWWRIEEIEPKTGGFLVKALPSDVNPDFS